MLSPAASNKLDYLLRDATSTGLPLRYDLDRYLHTVEVKKDFMVDPDGHLGKLYKITNANITPRRSGGGLLPREVYRFTSATSHAEGRLIRKLFLRLKERKKRAQIVQELEQAIGEELLKLAPELGTSGTQALWNAGVWVDAPKPPQVEEAELSGDDSPPVTIDTVFPIEEWTEAYQAHRYYLRVYAYSEYVEKAARAARKAMENKIGVMTDDFYEASRRKRD